MSENNEENMIYQFVYTTGDSAIEGLLSEWGLCENSIALLHAQGVDQNILCKMERHDIEVLFSKVNLDFREYILFKDGLLNWRISQVSIKSFHFINTFFL